MTNLVAELREDADSYHDETADKEDCWNVTAALERRAADEIERLTAILQHARAPGKSVTPYIAEIERLRADLAAMTAERDVWVKGFVREAYPTQSPDETPAPRSFQERVHDWMLTCFGAQISADTQERTHRFMEESLELVQAAGCSKSEVLQLVEYAYGRDRGVIAEEAGDVMITLAALCQAYGISLERSADEKAARNWDRIDVIRAKQAGKPKHSPLPQSPVETTTQCPHGKPKPYLCLDCCNQQLQKYEAEQRASANLARQFWDFADESEANAETGEVTLVLTREQAEEMWARFWELGGKYRSKLENYGWSPEKATAPLGTIHASHCEFGFTGICICNNASLL